MEYGVIVCPNCKNAKGVDLSVKTTRCGRCGKVLKLGKLKVMYRTNDRQKLQNAIGAVNAKTEDKLDEFKELFEKQK